jgi:hypothetical protein
MLKLDCSESVDCGCYQPMVISDNPDAAGPR